MRPTFRSCAATAVVHGLVLAGFALADPVGMSTEDATDALAASLGLKVCHVFVEFDGPANNLLSIGFSDITTDDPAGFFQHFAGSDTAPNNYLCSTWPELCLDSFVTIGRLDSSGGDATTSDPDWDSELFNTSGKTAGGWYSANPGNSQGLPDTNLRVLVGQLTIAEGHDVSGTAIVYFNDGLVPFASSFQCFSSSAQGQGGGAFGGPPGAPAVPEGAGGEPQGGSDPAECGDPTAGPCLVAHATPFCDCELCCEIVCTKDSFCCDTTWDAQCVDLAQQSCSPDCQGNGTPDDCDIAAGTSEDCNGDTIPDECEIDENSTAPGGPFFCNPAIDTCDPDCNDNGTPDDCEVDCNCSLVPDECEIAANPSDDGNSDGVLDVCQDCNDNGILDPCDTDCGLAGCGVSGCGESDDVNSNEIPDECEAAVRGPLFFSGHDADDDGHCDTAQSCGRLYPALIEFALAHSRIDPQNAVADILAIGVNGSTAEQAFDDWRSSVLPEVPSVEIVTDPAIIQDQSPNPQLVNFNDYRIVYVPTTVDETAGGIMSDQLAALITRRVHLERYVNFYGGGVIGLHQEDYSWLPVCLHTVEQEHHSVCPTTSLDEIPGHTIDLNDPTCLDLSPPGGPHHSVFTGPPGFLGLTALAISDDSPTGEVVLLGELGFCGGTCPADLNGNGVVNAADLAQLLGAWGNPGCDSDDDGVSDIVPCCADLNGNGVVNAADLAQLLGAWGTCP